MEPLVDFAVAIANNNSLTESFSLIKRFNNRGLFEHHYVFSAKWMLQSLGVVRWDELGQSKLLPCELKYNTRSNRRKSQTNGLLLVVVDSSWCVSCILKCYVWYQVVVEWMPLKLMKIPQVSNVLGLKSLIFVDIWIIYWVEGSSIK